MTEVLGGMKYRSSVTLSMVKAAARRRKPSYEPDIVAHELGHAEVHRKRPYLATARTYAPMAGSVLSVAAKTPVGLAGHLVPLADEAAASRRAVEILKDSGLSKEELKAARKRLGVGLASYGVRPAVDTGLTLAGIARDNPGLMVAAPVAGMVAERMASPLFDRGMDKIPIRNFSREEVERIAKKHSPETNMYFSARKFPQRGIFVQKPLIDKSEEVLRHSSLNKQLEPFLGRRASGKLLRRGGVAISPAK